jgi:hypothetical protein
VLVVATVTLLGFLAVEAAASALLPGQEYAEPAPVMQSAAKFTGEAGGLLPTGALRGRSHGTRLRDLRPAVLLLVQFPCECAARVKHVAAQADGSKVRVYVVGFHGRTQVDRLADAAGRGVVPMVDVTNTLNRTYHPGPEGTLVLVRRDGVVTQIFDGVPDNIDLRPWLPWLLRLP